MSCDIILQLHLQRRENTEVSVYNFIQCTVCSRGSLVSRSFRYKEFGLKKSHGLVYSVQCEVADCKQLNTRHLPLPFEACGTTYVNENIVLHIIICFCHILLTDPLQPFSPFHSPLPVGYWENFSGTVTDLNYSHMQLNLGFSAVLHLYTQCHGNAGIHRGGKLI